MTRHHLRAHLTQAVRLYCEAMLMSEPALCGGYRPGLEASGEGGEGAEALARRRGEVASWRLVRR